MDQIGQNRSRIPLVTAMPQKISSIYSTQPIEKPKPAEKQQLQMQNNPGKKRHLLTILVEDYFHVGAFENLIQQRNWSNFEPRYEQNTRKDARPARRVRHKGDIFCARLDRRAKSGADPRDRRARARSREPRLLSSQPEESDGRRISRRPSPHEPRYRGRLRAKGRSVTERPRNLHLRTTIGSSTYWPTKALPTTRRSCRNCKTKSKTLRASGTIRAAKRSGNSRIRP